jgi:hypothetical protein
MGMSEYSVTAKKLGIKLRFWKYGLQFMPRDPSGHVGKLIQVVPLDGWSFDSKDITESFRNDPKLGIDDKGNIEVIPDYSKKWEKPL